jgi:hypothetical protein
MESPTERVIDAVPVDPDSDNLTGVPNPSTATVATTAMVRTFTDIFYSTSSEGLEYLSYTYASESLFRNPGM